MKQNSEIILHGLTVRREVSERGGSSIYTCSGRRLLSRGGKSEKELEKWVLQIKAETA